MRLIADSTFIIWTIVTGFPLAQALMGDRILTRPQASTCNHHHDPATIVLSTTRRRRRRIVPTIALKTSFDPSSQSSSETKSSSSANHGVEYLQEEQFDKDYCDEEEKDEEEKDPGDDEDFNTHNNYNMGESSEDYAQESLLQIYARDKKWLEKATEDMIDKQRYPLGTLTEDDIDSIVGLMVAWVPRRSVSAGMAVENLLVRIVAEMRVENPVAQTTARMYSLAMDAWAKSGAPGSAERAQHIHDTMVQFYKETGNEALRPTASSYNILINAHGKSTDINGLDRAELVLQEMIASKDEAAKPNIVSFSTLLDSYAKSSDQTSVERTLKLLDLMDGMNIKRNHFTYTALQNVYATSGRLDSAEKTMEILEEMLQIYKTGGNPLMKPNCNNFNVVLGALSRNINGTKNAKLAFEMIKKMERPVSDGGYDVEPDKLSYALSILTCSRCPADFGIALAEEILLSMEARALVDRKRQLEVSSAAPPSVSLDLESFNLVLIALSKSRADDAVQRMVNIFGRMKKHAEEGYTSVTPSVRSWNALLNAISRSKGSGKIAKAENIIDHMYSLHDSGALNVKPDAFSFAALLTSYARSGADDVFETMRGMEDTLKRMDKLYEEGKLATPPDVYHYTIVINAWAKSGLPSAANRAMQLLAHMSRLTAQGVPNVKPNIRTYHAVLDALARGGAEGEAERLLDHMIVMDRQGEKCVDSVCFDSVIFAFVRSKKRGCGKRAESILDRLLDYSHEKSSCRPKARSFKQILSQFRISREPDAPYRAEYLLNRQISLYKAGAQQLEPDTLAFKLVMDTYSGFKHRDSGMTAERLLGQMRDLQQNYNTTRMTIDSSVMYCVLYAWLVSGDDDAGRRAEIHLDYMERKYKAGDETMKPDSRLYGLVLSAWAKSNNFEKAQRAFSVLKRMEKQQERGNSHVQPNEHCHSLVINACAFTNSGSDAEREAFRIAVATFNKMLASEDCQPSSLAYGWFIQACGRLKVSDSDRTKEIERAWKLCCDNGLVNAFVLHRFTGSAPEALYKKLLGPIIEKLGLPLETLTKEELKFKIDPTSFPKSWTENCKERIKDSANTDWWNTQ